MFGWVWRCGVWFFTLAGRSVLFMVRAHLDVLKQLLQALFLWAWAQARVQRQVSCLPWQVQAQADLDEFGGCIKL
jgi:hypothetical protein